METSKDPEQDTSNKEDYIKLEDFGFSYDKIVLLESCEEHVELLKKAFEEISTSDVIGLDSEWVKTKYPIKPNIFQIATRNKAYIFDFDPHVYINYLEKYIPSTNDNFNDLFEILLGEVFINENILKVAWDFDLDLKNLNNRYAFANNKKLHVIKGFVDLMQVAPKSIEKGLTMHTLHYLGKKLDKTHQVCDWDLRPMAKDRIIYAALDSIVTIPLYEKMKETISIQPGELDLDSVDKRMNEWKMRKLNCLVEKVEVKV